MIAGTSNSSPSTITTRRTTCSIPKTLVIRPGRSPARGRRWVLARFLVRLSDPQGPRMDQPKRKNGRTLLPRRCGVGVVFGTPGNYVPRVILVDHCQSSATHALSGGGHCESSGDGVFHVSVSFLRPAVPASIMPVTPRGAGLPHRANWATLCFVANEYSGHLPPGDVQWRYDDRRAMNTNSRPGRSGASRTS